MASELCHRLHGRLLHAYVRAWSGVHRDALMLERWHGSALVLTSIKRKAGMGSPYAHVCGCAHLANNPVPATVEGPVTTRSPATHPRGRSCTTHTHTHTHTYTASLGCASAMSASCLHGVCMAHVVCSLRPRCAQCTCWQGGAPVTHLPAQ